VCAGFGLEPDEVTDAAIGLVEKSVLVAGEGAGGRRLSMLETLREFGRLRLLQDFVDRLPDSPGEEAVAVRHLAWYADLAARFEREWFGPDQSAWMARMRTELPNVRVALDFCMRHPEHIRRGQRLAADLCQFWNAGPKREGVAWLTQLVEAAPVSSRELVHALSALSWVSSNGMPEQSWRYSEQAWSLVEEYAPEHVARVLDNHGVNLCTRGDPSALPLLEEAVTRAKADLGEMSGEAAYALFGLGFGLAMAGDAERSDRAFAEAVEICRVADERWWRAWVMIAQALMGWVRGDAEPLAEVSMTVLPDAQDLGDDHLASTALGYLAVTGVGRDDHLAAYLLGTCERFWEDAGGSVNRHEPLASALARTQEALQARLDPDTYTAEYRRGAQDSLETAIAVLLGQRSATTAKAPPRAPTGFAALTPRETEIAELVAQGLSNREVAARLVLSTRTVETHVQNIFTKTGFTSRVQLASRFTPRPETDPST
jgi:non-specific serine/threonine protein kinase